MTTNRIPLAALAAVAIAMTPSSASAFLYQIVDDHVDIGAALHGAEFHMHWHLHDLALEYEPDEAYVTIGASHFAPRPPGSSWDFLGVPAGSPVWFAPQGSIPGRPFLGLGAEEIPAGIFDGNAVTFRLVGLSGPTGANFALWQESFGSPAPFFSTADGIGPSDSYVMSVGGHEHFNWGFTSLGIYVLSLEVVGTQGGVPVVAQGDFTFAVGVPIPEPSTYAALAGGIALAIFALRRRWG